MRLFAFFFPLVGLFCGLLADEPLPMKQQQIHCIKKSHHKHMFFLSFLLIYLYASPFLFAPPISSSFTSTFRPFRRPSAPPAWLNTVCYVGRTHIFYCNTLNIQVLCVFVRCYNINKVNIFLLIAVTSLMCILCGAVFVVARLI